MPNLHVALSPTHPDCRAGTITPVFVNGALAPSLRVGICHKLSPTISSCKLGPKVLSVDCQLKEATHCIPVSDSRHTPPIPRDQFMRWYVLARMKPHRTACGIWCQRGGEAKVGSAFQSTSMPHMTSTRLLGARGRANTDCICPALFHQNVLPVLQCREYHLYH